MILESLKRTATVTQKFAVTVTACSIAVQLPLVPRKAEAQFSAAAKIRSAAMTDRGDTRQASKRLWDSQRDLPARVSSNKEIRFDYPIVYVQVPRPYPKEYYNINHLNQAGLHQTNAPGAEL